MKKIIFSESRALIEMREGLSQERLANLFEMKPEDLQERINTYLYHLYKTGFTVEELSIESGLSSEKVKSILDHEANRRGNRTEFNMDKSYYIQYIRGLELQEIAVHDEIEIVEKALQNEVERRVVDRNNIEAIINQRKI